MNCLPVYVIIDTSQSMCPLESAINQGIEFLFDGLIISPRVSDFVYVSIISFNTDAEVVISMTEQQSFNVLPQISCGGVSYFNEAIGLLRQSIDQDVPRLKNSGRQVLRPVAFLLTDGLPTDTQGRSNQEWRPNYLALVSESYPRRPIVVPFGYGQASPQFLKDIATLPDVAFLARGGTSKALQKVFPALLSILIECANHNELRLPAEVDGYIRLSNEIL
jgi:uncharacterized protein YegL